MNYCVNDKSHKVYDLTADKLQIGDIAQIDPNSGRLGGNWILMIHAGRIVNLNNPASTWHPASDLHMKVRKLAKGEVIRFVGE